MSERIYQGTDTIFTINNVWAYVWCGSAPCILDPIGGRKWTESHRSKTVLNGVLVNCITHLPTTAQYVEAPLEQFGKHNVDGISFVYENYPDTLTIWVKYTSCSLLKAKQKNGFLALKCTMIHLGQLKPVKYSLLTD
jgi:hypothetical protein